MELSRVPPVISDATKIGLAKSLDGSLTVDGEQVYELLLQEQWVDTFTAAGDFGHLTEVDSAANVDVSGGTLNIQGNGAWNVNGVRSTALITYALPFRFKITVMYQNSDDMVHAIGLLDGAALSINGNQIKFSRNPGVGIFYALGGNYWYDNRSLAKNTTYLLEFEGDTDKVIRVYITGGVFAVRTCIYNGYPYSSGANVGFGINAVSDVAVQHKYDDFTLEQGYDVGGETLTYIHDAGAGRLHVNFDPTLLAMPGGLVTTNLLFRWSFDDGVRAWSAWMTLANLNLVAKQFASHRYICIDVQLNSDGATQALAIEPNHATAVDYVVGAPVVPTWGPGEPSGIH